MAATTTATSPRFADSQNIVMGNVSDHPLQVIYNILSSLTDIPAICDRPLDSDPLLQVINLMTKVQLQHLGIPSNAVGRLRHGISMKVAEKEDMFDIAAFVLPRGFTLPLHDHPNMTVVSKLLLGEVQIRSFSRCKGHRDNSDPSSLSETSSGDEYKGSDDSVDCQLSVSTRKTAADAPWFLTPDDGNFHEITPITDCVLLDILLPPYDDHDRNCTFYEAQETFEGSWRLVPMSFDKLNSQQMFPLPVQYKGYRPQSR